LGLNKEVRLKVIWPLANRLNKTNPPMDKEQHLMLRGYAWNYFAMHADQRLKTFGFYLTLATIIVGAFATILKNGGGGINWKYLSVLPFLLSFMTFIFWKFELRNKQLVRNGEEALEHLDTLLPLENTNAEPHVLRIIARDAYFSGQAKESPHKRGWTYSRCFKAVFLVFGIAGLIVGLICVFH